MSSSVALNDTEDKYPNYTPENWYLSIIKPKNNRYTHLVKIRPLLGIPKSLTQDGSLTINRKIRYNGFILYRHFSDEATIIEYISPINTKKKIAVKDAKYRTICKMGSFGLGIQGLKSISETNVMGTWYIDGSRIEIPDYKPMPDTITSQLIYQQWGYSLSVDNSARVNCDLFMSYKKKKDYNAVLGVPAVEWCRSHTISDIPCDLPNEYEAIVIWACGDKLDEMDPSSEQFSNLRLGYTAQSELGYGRTQRCGDLVSTRLWSSTQRNDFNMRYVQYNGICGGNSKNLYCTAVPILEM